MSVRIKSFSRITRFAAAGTLVVGGITVGTGIGTGHASSTAANYGVCRRSPATEPVGVHLQPCLDIMSDGSGVFATITAIVDAGGTAAYPCSQLWRVNPDGTESFVHDFGCLGYWVDPGGGYAEGSSGVYALPQFGDYVLREGYWATLNGQYGYYGNVESQVLTYG